MSIEEINNKEFRQFVEQGRMDFTTCKFTTDIDFSDLPFKKGDYLFNLSEFKGNINISKLFKSETSFVFANALFKGKIKISQSHFKDINFNNSTFENEVCLEGDLFFKKLSGYGAHFKNVLTFSNSILGGDISFSGTELDCGMDCYSVRFDGFFLIENSQFRNDVDVDFTDCVFNKDFTWHSITVEKAKLLFTNAIFLGNSTRFWNINLKHVNNFMEFSGVRFLGSHLSINHLDGSVLLNYVSFTGNIIVSSCDINKWSIRSTNISTIHFMNCNFNEGKSNRIILYRENKPDKGGDIIKHFKGMEELYRQLKISFVSNSSIEFVGKAYFSEMEMKRRVLNLQNKYSWEWIVHQIYYYVGGYTVDYSKPLGILLFLVFIGWPFINIWIINDFSPIHENAWSLFKFLESVKIEYLLGGIDALPFLKIGSSFNNEVPKYLLKVEILINTIVLAFFILGVRRRYK
ncbi:MAG: hypothetical protein N4A45_05340 [Flavobacteriales bacterium]|jgi:uncharacterized protein YjbI with pentapeptide repeats|nr:hypothetical protein [Flavobacteriales bacterium]